MSIITLSKNLWDTTDLLRFLGKKNSCAPTTYTTEALT